MKEGSVQFFDRIQTSKNLPSLPQILIKLIKLCDNEESKIEDISQIINKDASLSAKVMNMVHSPYYGRSKRVGNIDQAVETLGTRAIKNIALITSDIQVFSKQEDNYVLCLKAFWKHSLTCAILSELIAKKISYPSPDEAFLAGLLHDIGKLILRTNLPRQSANILNSSKYQPGRIAEIETHQGATHCEVGAWMIKRWNLQSLMGDAVLYHHESMERIQDAFPLIKVIYVGNLLCPETKKEKVAKFEIAKTIFGFEISEVEETTFQAESEVSEIAQSLGIDVCSLDVEQKIVSETDNEKQKELIQEVKGITLLQSILQNLLEVHDEDSILNVLHQGLHILFDVTHISFFLYDSERDVLLGKSVSSSEQHDIINKITIPFLKEKSLLVKSLLQRNPLNSFSDSIKDHLTIIDEQLIRLIGKDGILCLPMIANKQYVGVIVLGIEESRISLLTKEIKLLMMYSKQAALALYASCLIQNKIKIIQSENLSVTSTKIEEVVHEANTPLSIIKNYLFVLKNKLPEDEFFQEEIKIIKEEVDRLALIIRELSDSSMLNVQPNEPLDLNALLADLIKIFQRSDILEPNIKAHLQLDPSLPTILTDKNKMTQVFRNLIMNAIEAMSTGGNLFISTLYVSNFIDPKLTSYTDIILGHIEITIRDDGPGIIDTVKPSLFEPYVTSKREGHAGLGLSIVSNKIKELKGTLTCESDNKNGTSFKIVFPIESTHEM